MFCRASWEQEIKVRACKKKENEHREFSDPFPIICAAVTTAGITIGESNIGERDYYANVDTVLDDEEEDEDDIHHNYTNTNKEKLKRIHTLRRRMTTTTSVDFVVLLLLEPVTTTTTANRTAALRSQDFGAPQCTCSAAAVQ